VAFATISTTIRRSRLSWSRSRTRAWPFDRERKGSLYARARLREYWIVNLVDQVLEVYREPAPDAAAPFGWAYRVAVTLGPDEFVTPLAAPSARILVADFLP
jgi:Uma2 family endonuclease